MILTRFGTSRPLTGVLPNYVFQIGALSISSEWVQDLGTPPVVNLLQIVNLLTIPVMGRVTSLPEE